MVSFSKVSAALAGFSAVAMAAPTTKAGTSFSVTQVPRPASGKNIPALYAKTLTKYGATVPDSVKAAAENGSVITSPTANDAEYIATVTVGTSTLHLDFDTGSADLWVFSSELPLSDTRGHSVYTPSRNATKLDGYGWNITYGDGSYAGGDVYRDYVSIGGVSTTQQAVEAASKISPDFAQQSPDGLLGLGFSSLNTVKPQAQTTFFDTVKSQLDQPLFAVALKHNAPGTYDFGKIDASKYTGTITYTNVDSSQGFWSFNATGYAVGNGAAVSFPINGIADTGTSLFMLPTQIVNDYYKGVSGAQLDQTYGGMVFPCSAQLPHFTVMIGNYKAVVPGNLINYTPVSAGSSTCFGGIQDQADAPFSVFGDVFLKSQYVVFNADGPKLGFAPQA
ncbi:hypothetical protein VTN77DRAFT_5180 [Rasamsonia byssochlamydoides]|uniref:uncharacterized protein n=1 Tax=Rasamsonia byssochlamydoides TaxID=89139 RepID=UPI003744A45F